MAKAATTAVTTQGQRNQLPAEFKLDDSELADLGNLGYSEDANDSLIPILAILQDNSGEVKKGHSKRIEGAAAGNGILRSMKLVLPLDEMPTEIIPVGFQHMWVQWRGEPGDGKIIKQYPYDERPEEAEERQDPSNPDDDRMFWAMPNGDRLVDTRYHYVLALINDDWMPVVIPMAGTNHTVSRMWTGQMKAVKLPTGVKAPSWFRRYALSTKFNQRGQQSWYTYEIADLGWVIDRALRELGKGLNKGVADQTVAPDVKGEGAAADEVEDSTV